MTAIDIVILIIIGAGIVIGMMRGLIKQACAVVGLIAGLLVARGLYTMVGEQLAPHIGTSVSVAQIISFVVIWAVVPTILMVAGMALTKVLEAASLGIVNRLLGAVLGALLNVLFLGMLFKVIEYIDPGQKLIREETKEESAFYNPVKETAGLFFPVIEKVTHEIIK